MKQRTYQIQVEEITVTVIKKQMKNMYLRIRKEDGSVLNLSACTDGGCAHLCICKGAHRLDQKI